MSIQPGWPEETVIRYSNYYDKAMEYNRHANRLVVVFESGSETEISLYKFKNFAKEIWPYAPQIQRKKELIEEIKRLYNDIDECNQGIVDSRIAHEPEEEKMWIYKMGKLMVEVQQDLDCILDYLEGK